MTTWPCRCGATLTTNGPIPRPDGLYDVWGHVWGLRNEKGEWPPCHTQVEDTRLSISLVEEWILDFARQGWQIEMIAYDPYRFERSAQTLAESFMVMEFPQTDSNMIPATEDLFADVSDALIVVPDDEVLERHWLAGVMMETGRGLRLTKREIKGKPRKPNDLLIAAHTLALGLILVTANVDEFGRVPHLPIENWLG